MYITKLIPTTTNDLDFVLAAELDPQNAKFVYHWTREEHLEALTNPDYLHYIIWDNARQKRCGYVILADINNPSHSIDLRRIVVTHKGHNIGRQTLYQIQKIAFTKLGAHRLWLDVFIDNERAYKLYQKVGFRIEGQLRDSYLRSGKYISQYIMAMLDTEYNNEKPTN